MIGASTKLFAQLGPCQHHCIIHCTVCKTAQKSQNQNGHLRSCRAQGSSLSIQLTSGSGSRWCRLCTPGPAPTNQEEPNHHYLVGAFDTIFGILLLEPPFVIPKDKIQCTPQWTGWTCLGTDERRVDVLMYCAPIFLLPFLELCPMSLAAPRSLCTFCQGQNQIINSNACY